jgi:hypothetical protein
MSKESFITAINKSYTTGLPSIYLGAGILNGEIVPDAENKDIAAYSRTAFSRWDTRIHAGYER